MTFEYHEVDPTNDAGPSEFNQSIEEFGNFIGGLEKAIKNAEFDSDKEDLKEFKDSIGDRVEVFKTGGFTITVMLDGEKDLQIYKVKDYCNLEVTWIDFKDENLEIHMRDKDE